jgi:hypothetical protein
MNDNDESANYIINITLHILILFTFLTLFFFLYISKIEKENINSVTNSLIKSQTDQSLTNLEKKLKEYNQELPKDKLANLANKMNIDSTKDIPEIKNNNKNLIIKGSVMCGILLLIFIGLIIYYKYYKKYDIDLKHILIENIIIFSFTGIIEFLFFTQIASKFIPVTPDIATSSTLDQISTNINKNLIK